MSGELAIGIAAGFTILYTTFGGLLVDAITDVIQSIVLAIGLVIVLVAVVSYTGGASEVGRVLSDPTRLHLMPQGAYSRWSSDGRYRSAGP